MIVAMEQRRIIVERYRTFCGELLIAQCDVTGFAR